MSGPERIDLGLKKVAVHLEHDGGVIRIALDSPPGNILDSEMMTDLRTGVAAVRDYPQVRLVVFSGEGKHFSFGASVKEHLPDQVRGMLESFHGLFRDLVDLDLPCLALVCGKCLGGGLELAAFCDWVFAEETAELGQPEIRLGVFAPMGSILLPWRCGAQGGGMLLTGGTVDAITALTMGLVDEMAPAGQGETRLARWITEQILPLSASSLRRARKAARRQLNRTILEELQELETLYLDDLMQTHDAVEGLQAFMEKRVPVWTHR